MRRPMASSLARVLLLPAALGIGLTAISTTLPSAAAAPPAGLARGKVALVADDMQVHAFSATTGRWTSLELTAPLRDLAVSDLLGFALTDSVIAVFKSISDCWATSSYAGSPRGQDLESATAIFWTTRDCYGISTVWAQWARHGVPAGERVLGGGSAGTFGICWTSISALAYNGSTGQWSSTLLRERPLGGIACSGIGLIWTADALYAFSSGADDWVPLQCGALQGMSICGSGSVALAWGTDGAHAYSTDQDAWFPVSVNGPVLAGQADGETALLWTQSEAFGFRATTGEWEEVELHNTAAGLGERSPTARGTLLASPNPSPTGRLHLRLPRDGHWELTLVDASGRQVARRAHDTSAGGREILWQPAQGEMGRLPAGIYWLHARGPAGEEEVRRITVLR